MKRNNSFTLEDIKKSKVWELNQHLADRKRDAKGSAKRKSKYGSNKKEVDGILFDSEKEAKRYGELKILLKIGEIELLEMQVPFLLIEDNETERKCQYYADFVYRVVKTGKRVVEDVKSEMTRKLPVYIMKRKLMKTVHNITIYEV